MTAGAALVKAEPDLVLAKYAAEIRRLGKRVKEDVVAIGRYLDQAQKHAGRGAFLAWIKAEFGWSGQTAYRFIHLYQAHQDPEFHKLWNSDLPVSGLYQLAAPKTPDAARTEIAERLEAGETVSCTTVTDVIAQAKAAEDTEAADPEKDASIEARRAEHAALFSESDTPKAGNAETSTTAPSTFDILLVAWESASEPDRCRLFKERGRAEIIAAMDSEFLTELGKSFEQQLGRHNSENGHLEEISALARDCSALLEHAGQNRDGIRKKLSRIRSLTGTKGRARRRATKSNAQLDRGALARGLGIAGPPGKEFPTLTMTPSTDAAGNIIHALPRA